jgi:26S proteasome regulatory subunit T3
LGLIHPKKKPLKHQKPQKQHQSAPCGASPAASAAEREDLYTRLKTLERQLEFVTIQENYVRAEQRHLRREHHHARAEIDRIKSVPLLIGQFLEMITRDSGIVGSTSGSNSLVRVLSTINRELLKPSASVALHRHSSALVEVLPPEADSAISVNTERPDVRYEDIGGLDVQKQEVREAVELPLTHFELYRQVGPMGGGC